MNVRQQWLPRRGLLLWLLAALLWFGPLNSTHLFEPDEGRYAEIPREMVQSGDWVTPRLDAIKYFEKPPLQYWATALAFTLFGAQAWSTRLWPALSGFLGLVLTGFLGRRLYGARTAALAMIIQGSSLLYLGLARIATLDMSLCFALQIAMSALALLAEGPSAKQAGVRGGGWQMPCLLGLGIALAVLAKGLVGILIPGAVACLYMLCMRDWSLPWRAQPWWTLIALAALAAPWFLLVAARNPEFAHFFFVVQHFQRYLSSSGFDRYAPAWFFIPVLAAGFLPWTSLLPRALWQAFGAARRGERGTALLALWALFVFMFFSLSQSKLIPYILPLIPALALLCARSLAGMAAPRFARHLAALGCFAAAMVALILLLWSMKAAAPLVTRASPASILGFALAFLWLALGAAIGMLLARRARPLAAAAAAGLGGWMLAQSALLGAEQLPRMQYLIAIEQRTAPWVGNSTRIYCVNDYWQPLPFYWQRPCTLVGYRGELDFGLQQEPWRGMSNLQQFASDWERQSDALAILRPEDYRQLQALGLPMRVIYTAGSLVAVVRR
ncbi:MAG: glycosyltransferase family 39 protein [Steroidobacteraceae bacterium]|jgi:4-amino-4-deoxy-L-arabinose transferase-like glycosyltransferase